MRSPAGVGESVRVDVPDGSPPAGETCLVYTRRFNRPSGLTDADRVELIVSNWAGKLTALVVNDQALPFDDVDADFADAGGRWDITDLLIPANFVTIELSRDGKALPCLNGDVRLRIVAEEL